MNYYVMQFIKYILVVICLVIAIVINALYIKRRSKESDTIINTIKGFYSKKKGKKFKILNFLIFLIIYIGIFALPFDSLIKHKTIEDAFYYTYPAYKIKERYVYEDCAYILYSHKGENGFAYFVKENENWNLIKNQNIQSKTYNSYLISTYRNESYNNSCKNKAGISVITTQKTSENIKIKDSQSSKFITIILEDKLVPSNNFISNLALIDDVDDNYTIFIDNKEFNPFQ